MLALKKILPFETFVGISSDLLMGEYRYFLEPHILAQLQKIDSSLSGNFAFIFT